MGLLVVSAVPETQKHLFPVLRWWYGYRSAAKFPQFQTSSLKRKHTFRCDASSVMELCWWPVVFQGRWSGTGGRSKRRDHWSVHTYYHYAPPQTQQPATACGSNRRKWPGHYCLINSRKYSNLSTRSVGQDTISQTLLSRSRGAGGGTFLHSI